MIQAFVLMDALFVILNIPWVDKSLTFHWYKTHNLQLLHPMLQTSFHYDIDHKYFAIRSYM